MQLTVRAPFNALLGYGHVSWNLCDALSQSVGLSIFPIGGLRATNAAKLNFKGFQTFNPSDPCLTIWHEHDLIANALGKGKKVAYPFFELNAFDELRLKNLRAIDEIIVASDWAKQVLDENGIKTPCTVAPPGVNQEIFKSVEVADHPYRFFTFGKYEYRKGTELVADFFGKAFSPTDNVELYICCDSPLEKIRSQVDSFVERLQNHPMRDRIKVVQGSFESDAELAQFFQIMDCGVFPTRAEGYGLPILQSMACGKQIITTDYSGHTQFCTTDNAHLVHIEHFEPASDGVWFGGIGTWAAIGKKQCEEFVEIMRGLYKNEISLKYPNVEKFTWENCTNNVLLAFDYGRFKERYSTKSTL